MSFEDRPCLCSHRGHIIFFDDGNWTDAIQSVIDLNVERSIWRENIGEFKKRKTYWLPTICRLYAKRNGVCILEKLLSFLKNKGYTPGGAVNEKISPFICTNAQHMCIVHNNWIGRGGFFFSLFFLLFNMHEKRKRYWDCAWKSIECLLPFVYIHVCALNRSSSSSFFFYMFYPIPCVCLYAREFHMCWLPLPARFSLFVSVIDADVPNVLPIMHILRLKSE